VYYIDKTIDRTWTYMDMLMSI